MCKAILIIDMPESCKDCKLRFTDEWCDFCAYANPERDGVWHYVTKNSKPDWCPLKPLPPKLDNEGWNDCIDTILGEENENN